MKKFVTVFISLLGLASMAQGQSVTITIDAGLLENANGTAAAPVGSLLQLIASPSGSFVAPTATSFVGGDNVLLNSFAMNYNGGVTGETTNTFTISTSNITTGEALLLRFYPSLTSTTTTQMPGTKYGQVRSTDIENPSDPSETAWVAPASGAVDLDYFTMSDAGGPNANATAFASNTVVPEPSTYGLFGGMFACTMCLRIWNRRLRTYALVG